VEIHLYNNTRSYYRKESAASKGIEIHMFGTISKENTRILYVVSIEIIWLRDINLFIVNGTFSGTTDL
jgi:hypothetical protein